MKWLHESYGRVTSKDSLSREKITKNLLLEKLSEKLVELEVYFMYL